MSFPRAKLHRFNENSTDAPSPTRYDPKLGKNAKGCVIGKERVRTVSSTSDTTSTAGTPFRTPYAVGKKNNCSASSEKNAVVKSMMFQDTGVAPLPCSEGDEGLRVELASKDQALLQYSKLVEELTQQVNSTEKQKLDIEKEKLALEAANAELECVVANNQNCETQIQALSKRLSELETQLDCLRRDKDELYDKWTEEVKRSGRLEDGNHECEKRIISLEGTLEQVQLEYDEKVKEVNALRETADQLKISIEMMQGKIAALENEVSRLETIKSTNEETIFGLEEKASSLSFSLEAARAETQAQQEILVKLNNELDDRKNACLLHEKTITGLDMQLDEKQREILTLSQETKERISALDTNIAEITRKLKEVETRDEERNQLLDTKDEQIHQLTEEKKAMIEQHNQALHRLREEKEVLIQSLKEQQAIKESELQKMQEDRKLLIRQHDEHVFHLHDEWEKKILAQMQESEQALLEKEAVLKLADFKNTKMLNEAREEFEAQLRQAQEEASRRQSAQLEAGEMMKAKYETIINDLENSMKQVLETKALEAAAEAERYKEVCDELSEQIKLNLEKQKEIASLTSCNHKTSTRLNNMLEEVKILNAENAQKEKELHEMTEKFNDEWKKNEKLSEQLGELDSKVAAFSEELKARGADRDRLAGELKKAKEECHAMRIKNLDLELNVVAHQDTANNLSAELDSAREAFNSQLIQLSTELSGVKQQCRKFEIAMADTRKSLEALGQRLIESENEVERLNQENALIRSKLATTENDKNEADNKYRCLMDEKIDLDQRIQAAEAMEDVLNEKVKELELKNCELELTRNEVQIAKDTLEEDKKNYEAALETLKMTVNELNLKLIEQERDSLEQVDQVSQALISKLDAFQLFSTEQIQKLNKEIQNIAKEKDDMTKLYNEKCEEFEILNTDHDILKTTFEISNNNLKKHYEEQRLELDRTTIKFSKMEEERNILKEKLEIVSATAEKLGKDLEENLAVITKLCDEKERQDLFIEQLKTEIAEKETSLNTLKQELDAKKAEFDENLKSITSSKDEEINLLKNEQKEYQAKILKNTDEVLTLFSNLEKESKQVELLTESNKQHLQTVKSLQQTVSDLEAALEKSQKSNAEITAQMEVVTAKENTEWKTKWERLLEEKEAISAELLAVTDRKDIYKGCCLELEQKLKDANNERDDAIKDFDEIHKVLKEKESTISSLKKRTGELESLIGPFREQLEQYETERMMYENDFEQLRRQQLEQAAKLGHQNHKQKIQHVVKLKNDILELRKENTKLQVDVKKKNKMIEKLREEVGEHPKRIFLNGKRPTSTPFKGKENDESMSPHAQMKQEPMSPTPNALRNRNY